MNMSDKKAMKLNPKKRVVFNDMKSKPLSTKNINNNIRRNSITTQRLSNLTSQRRASIQTSIRIKRRRLSVQHQSKEKETVMVPDVEKNESESQTTLELLEKIRQTAHPESIGPMPLSLQVCLNLKKIFFFLVLLRMSFRLVVFNYHLI
jgi:uncharacterized protein YllA (UPF0747 family)